jgi:hypothetical protein
MLNVYINPLKSVECYSWTLCPAQGAFYYQFHLKLFKQYQSRNFNRCTIEPLPSDILVTSRETNAVLSHTRGRRIMRKTPGAARLCHCSCHLMENSRGRY